MMTRYVDVVVIPVPTAELDTYRDMAASAGEVWMKHGALEYFEGVSDGGSDEDNQRIRTLFDLTETTADESLVFAFITFESREHRDEVNTAVKNDSAYQEQFAEDMPFNPDRMTTGGFSSIVNYTE